MEKIRKIVEQFNIEGELIDIKCNNNGSINKTYIVTYKMPSGELKKYVIQKINTTVFKDPFVVMNNIANVTNWIESKQDSEHPCLKLIPTKENSVLAIVEDEKGNPEYYRAYNNIDNSITYDVSQDKDIVHNTGQAFGHFQKMLNDFPIDQVEDTIKDFHNTKKRYADLLKAASADLFSRREEVKEELEFFMDNSYLATLITDGMDNKSIPTRITHNDTKVNNVMMDKDTGRFLTVIDLDTVMLGSVLYDYGDGIRSAAASAAEDETDLDKVFINLELFEAYTDGYLEEMAPYLTKGEIDVMGESIAVITYELASRFLKDYLNGDTYFKTNYSNHNLVRARNQIRLLQNILANMPQIKDYIEKSYSKKINSTTQNKILIKK